MRPLTVLSLLLALGAKLSGCDEVPTDNGPSDHRMNITEVTNTLEAIRINYELFNATETRSATSARSFNFLYSSIVDIFDAINPFTFVYALRQNLQSKSICVACNLMTSFFTNSYFSKDVLAYTSKAICNTFRIQTPRVCESLVDSVKDELDYIRLNTKLSSAEMCGVLLGTACFVGHSDKLQWELTIPPKVKWPARKNFKSNWTQAKFVQITDIHVDSLYTPGSHADCDEPLCCRPSSVPADVQGQSSRAGQWADYRRCDISLEVLEDSLHEIKTRHPDAWFWLWTGDIAPHNVWDVTRDQVREAIDSTTAYFAHYRDVGVPIFPILGNHEGVSINSFSPPDLEGEHTSRWLFEYSADKWAPFLPKHAMDTFRRSGSYRIKLADNLILLAANSNYCSRMNFWTYYDTVDPGGQLKWLSDELLKAEWHRDKVHLVMHIPPDNRECTQAWLFNYLKIIERYQDIIAGQYFGHTHRDEFRVLYSVSEPSNSKPIGVQHIAPSLTSYSTTNPSYRVYYIDNAGTLTNYETYSANLTVANEYGPESAWLRSYDALDFYRVKTLNERDFDAITSRLENSPRDFDDFFQIYMTRSDSPKASCDQKCKINLLDDLRVDHPYLSEPKELQFS